MNEWIFFKACEKYNIYIYIYIYIVYVRAGERELMIK